MAPRLCWHNAPQLWHVLWGGLECENQRGKGPAKRASLTEPAQGQAGQPQAGEGEEV